MPPKKKSSKKTSAKTRKPKPATSAPAWLHADAVELYQRLEPKANDSNRESVQAACHCWGLFLGAAAQIESLGTVVVTSTGNLRKNPAFDIAKVSLENFVRISKLLGLYEEIEEVAASGLDDMRRW